MECFVVSSDSRWYLVQCKSRESFRAAAHLSNQGYTCFHPTHHVKRKRLGSVSTQLEPLFPPYLFVLLSATDNWSSIRSTYGVSQLVTFGGVPVSLDALMIGTLQRQCAKLKGEIVQPLYQVGDSVLITEGCFKDIEAIVTATRSDERVVLLLNLFNRNHHVEMSASAVENAA